MKLVDEFTCWEAGFLQRWHANPSMVNCGDTVSSHSHRMAVLACYLFTPSRELLEYIALHDLGEVGSGDVAYPFKKAHPECYKLLEDFGDEVVNSMGLYLPELNTIEEDQLWLLDRLDAYLMMLRHNPHLAFKKSWEVGFDAIMQKAQYLGVADEVENLMGDVFNAGS